MIVPMKKLVVVTQAKDAESAVRKLRAFAQVHVENQELPKAKEISGLQEDLNLASEALDVLSKAEFATACEGSLQRKEPTQWQATCHHVIDIWKRLDQLEEYSRNLILKIKEWEIWGDFDPAQIQDLARQGIYMRLYQVPAKEMGIFPSEAVVKRVASKGNIVYCAVVSREQLDIALKEVEIPKASISHMRKRLNEDHKTIEALRDDLRSSFCYHPELERIRHSLRKELEFREALHGMGQAEGFTYIVGFIPSDAQEMVSVLAKKEHWGILISEPAEQDIIPTFIRNPRWISLIAPVFKVLEVVPGYHELDVSAMFLIFLSLFFGMIIGDAGYGAVYFLLTILAQWRWGKKTRDKSVFFLFYLFSFCAIIWGLLTGTVFGQEWYLNAGSKALAPILNNTKFLQAFCFFLGAFHLTLAHSWQALVKLPSPKALADIGWICVLWAAFFMAKLLILGDSFPLFGNWLLGTGIVLVILFTSPKRNVLKTIGSGLATVALSLMNNFTDVVSYIRLFAVGLAGVAIANTVNTLAAETGGNILAKVLILFVGHTINIILGPMSVLVHGIRLNVLEFSGHANVTWSGISYKPLKE